MELRGRGEITSWYPYPAEPAVLAGDGEGDSSSVVPCQMPCCRSALDG
jgi:hypothetical protein